jgi:hypothetical protein
MLEMLLDRQGESEQVRDELIGASLSHVASLRQPRGGAKAAKVLYRPLLKYLPRGVVGTLEPKVREPSSTSGESW